MKRFMGKMEVGYLSDNLDRLLLIEPDFLVSFLSVDFFVMGFLDVPFFRGILRPFLTFWSSTSMKNWTP